MLKKTIFIQIAIVYLMSLGCANIFSEMADKGTDKARLYEAQMKLGKGDWDGAIEAINLMSTDYQALRNVKVLKSSAYSGKCGLNFIELASTLQNSGASSFFSILLTGFTGGTAADLTSCIAAETILKSIGDADDRTSEENLLMAFNSLTKMGVILNIYADTDANGVIDNNYEPCHDTAATGLVDLPMQDAVTRADNYEMATGLSLFVTSMTAAGATSVGGSTFTGISGICATLAGAVGTDPCATTERADMTAAIARATRAALVDNSGVGLSLSNGATSCALATCYANNSYCADY